MAVFLGLALYFFSLYLLFRRYVFPFKKLDIKKDWYNTNCVIHGALSISGLAGTISKVIHPNVITIIWYWALISFVIVELIELYRASIRVKHFGFVKGIFTYHISQWTRNFTFGMFFALTLKMTSNRLPSILVLIHNTILKYGVVVIIGLLLYEIILYFRENFSMKYLKLNTIKKKSHNEYFS